MAFTRSFLKASGLSDEQVAAVMEEHVAVTDALKRDRDSYKAEAEKLPEVQKQLNDLKGGEDYKQKYEDTLKEFDDFKKKAAEDAEAAKVRAAYRSLLIDEKIGVKWLDDIIRYTDFSKMKIDKDGKLANESELRKEIDDKCGNFRTTIVERGAKVENPPAAGVSRMSKEEILKIQDTTARQKAIAENLDLFGKG